MRAYLAPRVFDSEKWHENAAIVVQNGGTQIVPVKKLPNDVQPQQFECGFLAPGFVDLQVNGGGGVMFNDIRSVEAIRTICTAHQRFGTTALLPTLITDRPDVTTEAIEAGRLAATEQVPGFLGLHLEGPHLSVSRKGAHDPQLIRPMQRSDLEQLIAAKTALHVLLSTVAVESVSPAQIEALSAAGIVVSLGHTDSTLMQARAAADAGTSMATHLFNAMSQLGNREPGLVGAVLTDTRVFAGLIADGIHVVPETIKVALSAKRGDGRIFLVTDAMSTIGTDLKSFTLNGREIRRENGRLTLADGTLAGADLDMISAVRFMHRTIGLELAEALRMASLYPAQAVKRTDIGRLGNGARADFIHVSDNLDVMGTWVDGQLVYDHQKSDGA